MARTVTKKPATTNLTALQTRIADIATRMKRADTQTRRSVKSLEKAFEALEARLGKDANINRAALSRRITALSTKLTNTIKTTQKDVNQDLRSALANPSVEGVEAALNSADERLTRTEQTQATSIARINRHIADLARAIEDRFAQEAEDRNAALESVKFAALSRIEEVERESINAISGLGEKVVSISNQINQRADMSEETIKEKVSEIALKTQEEFEQYRMMLERRIEAIESESRDTAASADRALTGLETRLEGVEYGVSDAVAKVEATPKTVNAPYQSAPQPVAANMAANTILDDAIGAEPKPVPIIKDAFAPNDVTALSEAVVPPNPYAIPEPKGEAVPEQDSHIPQEFDPSAVTTPLPVEATQAVTTPRQNYVVPTAPAEPQHYALDSVVPKMPEPAAPSAAPQVPETAPVYADPAYADPAYGQDNYAAPLMAPDTMETVRPGDFGPETKRKFAPNFSALPGLEKISGKLPAITPRNLKVAGIAATVGIVGIIGLKSLSGNDAPPETPPKLVASTSPTSGMQGIQAPALEMAPTIGNYEDNRADVPPVGTENANTLDAAAQSGNPIAEFQLGISYLETGRTKEAVSLIRKAADKGQPAAQYRLAKLYEVGEGIPQNAEMARKLTERAARAGNRIAMHDLALYFAEGRGGVDTDLEAAAQWFEKAASRGVVDSQFNLGVLFEMGKGVPQNIVDSYVWYGIAAKQGDQFAKQRIETLTATLPPEDRARGDERIRTFKPAKIDQAANGIFKDLPWTVKKPTQSALQVKQAQTLLNSLGFDAGGADGAMGPKTRTAIKSFERAYKMPETGAVSDDLLEKLEVASGA